MINTPAEILFNIHSAPPVPSRLTITARNRATDEVTEVSVELQPTINWVQSSTTQDSHVVKLPVNINLQGPNTPVPNYVFNSDFDIDIQCQNSNVLICGYELKVNLKANYFAIAGVFDIASQPVWKSGAVYYWYDGHNHVDPGGTPSFSGPGSLVIDAGDRVSFRGLIQTVFVSSSTIDGNA